MKILTAAQMAEVDRRTAEEFGVPVAELMDHAGAAVAQYCLRQYPAAKRVLALCGKGNNGGDGLVAARWLAGAGVQVEVWLLGRVAEVKGEAAGALGRLRADAAGVNVKELVEEESPAVIASRTASTQDDAGGADLILDAVVGTGFKPPLRGVAAALRDWVAKCDVPVVAVDLPSGWDADSIEQEAEAAFRADAVVTFTRPKMAHVFGSLTGTVFGPVVVASIGSPDAAIDLIHRDDTVMKGAPRLRWTGAAKAVAEKPRGVNGNKGKFGHVLVVGGSYGTAGAPSMASLAAMRTGAGLVTAAVPKSVLDLVAGIAPELMMAPLKEGAEGAASMENLGAGGLEELMKEKRITVVALGPGLSTRGEASKFARELVARTAAGEGHKAVPIVIDADALNAFAGRDDLLHGKGRVMVLTPHPGEMARLVGKTIKEVEADRIGLARKFATEHSVTLVLKGWRTLVAHPDGRMAVNTTGNPAMAKGGSGDILTGICAAMLAQYAASGEAEDVASAIEAAVYLHGLAGDFAALKMDEHTVLATDTVECLSDAFRYRVTDEDGFTWISGMHGVKA